MFFLLFSFVIPLSVVVKLLLEVQTCRFFCVPFNLGILLFFGTINVTFVLLCGFADELSVGLLFFF